MSARGVFIGELVKVEVGPEWADLTLGQEQYERPVLVTARAETVPAGTKSGDQVIIEGRVQANLSKRGQAYQVIRADVIRPQQSK